MKKIFTICVMLCCMMVAMAQEFTATTAEGYELLYTVTDADAKTVGCKGLGDHDTAGSADLVIPEKVEYEDVEYTVTSIGYQAFYECSDFTGSLVIGNGVENIGSYAFEDCSGLTGSLTIPDGVKSIEEGAFDGCSGLTGSLTIGAGVTSIGDWAFYGCSGLMGSLTLGDSVTSIGFGAFEGCSGFTGSLTIPNGVERIEDNAFYGCSGFTGDLTIGDGVESIGNWAFEDCSGLTSVTNKALVPQVIDENVFRGVAIGSIPLYVPEESISLYEGAAVWKDFMSVSEIADSSLEDTVSTTPFTQAGNELLFAEPTRMEVYSVSGAMVYSGIATHYTLPSSRGVYIVCTEKGGWKVIY